MLRALTAFLSASVVLTGCVSVDSLMPEPSAAKDTSFYRIDTKARALCLGETTRCRDYTKIVSALPQLRPIEKDYGTQVKGPNYPVSLMRIMMQPADGAYVAQPLGTDGRHFSIPITPRTQKAWRILEEIERSHYDLGA